MRGAWTLGVALVAAAQTSEVRFTDVSAAAGMRFVHQSGAAGKKWLPETMGPGVVFFDYDADRYPDLLLVNGRKWEAGPRNGSSLTLYRNTRDGRFADVTQAAGLSVDLYGMGATAGDFDNDGFPDLLVTTLGQNRLFRNTGKGGFVEVTRRAGLLGKAAFSTSALWFDYNRDGWLDLFVANYVQWSPERDVYCTLDGRTKAYCTPEAYRGSTSWLFRNRRDGTFEDVTAKAGIFDASSKSLGVAVLDVDQDGWPDLFVANDTQPNKLYRNQQDGTFAEMAVRAGLAFSDDGKARAGMGVDAADFDNSGRPGIAVTNFDNEMLGLYKAQSNGVFVDLGPGSAVGRQSRRRLGFGCFFFDADLDGWLDLLVVNGHIDESIVRARTDVAHAQPPHLFLNEGARGFRDVAAQAGPDFARPKVGRGAAYADYDLDGDLDVVITTNQGPAFLFRNDSGAGNRAVRVRLVGTGANRDAVGAVVSYQAGDLRGTRTVKSGSGYLSQSELPLTLGLGRRARPDRVSVLWPDGRAEELAGLEGGRRYVVRQGRGARVE